MKKLTQEEVLLAIFEGPMRPLTEEDQKVSDEANLRYEERKRARLEGYATLLELPIEHVEEMYKRDIVGLIQRVAGKKMSDQRLLWSIGGK